MSRRGLTVGAAVAAALAVAALASSALARPAATGNAATRGLTVSVCPAGALTAVYVDSTAGAGSVDAEYGFKNRGARACVLTGFPSVRLRTSSGRALATTEQHAPGAYGITVGRVNLARGAIAYFGVHYAAQTGYGNLQCPTSATLQLTAPGQRSGQLVQGAGGRIQAFGGSTVHLHCGILHVSALSAKRFQ